MVKILTLLVNCNKILSEATLIPNIQFLVQEKLERSFSPKHKIIKMFNEKKFFSNLIHANLCLVKFRLQFLNIYHSLRHMSFSAMKLVVESSVYCSVHSIRKFSNAIKYLSILYLKILHNQNFITTC